jgi:hypothetical protein
MGVPTAINFLFSVGSKSSWPVFVTSELAASYLLCSGVCPGNFCRRGSVSRGLLDSFERQASRAVPADVSAILDDNTRHPQYHVVMSDQAKYTPLPTLDQLEADLAAAEADIEAGRIVPGDVLTARVQAALDRYEAEQRHGPGFRAAHRR